MENGISRTEKRKIRNNRHIMDVAIDLFADRGIDNVSLEEIAEKADVARATLYNHFANKQELLQKIMKPIFDEGNAYIQEVLSVNTSIRIDKILLMCVALWKNYRNPLRLAYRIKHEQMGPVMEEYNTFITNFMYLFEKSREKRLFRFKSPQLTAFVVYKTFVPLLESIESVPGYENLFIESFKGFLLRRD
ncbi:MAG: hypothetical protein CVV44_06770 [Spirochaetae bacterium HGW-Spirochaetae-1]|jgi:AcrR family transcriptional regulator|nr:MAG: hypothetical protein CVV44_06770 [Spirochaetae bacterium HGW-Spirochaetae-1]